MYDRTALAFGMDPDEPATHGIVKPRGPDDPVQIILKVSGNSCNLRCQYCYERARLSSSSDHMLAGTLREFLSRLGDRSLSVQLHGGEPLMLGMPRMAELMDELRRYPGEVRLIIQTNGLLLSEEWLRFLDRAWPDIEIGLSVDGRGEANGYRVDHSGRATDEGVMAALRLCEDFGREIGIIAVVHRRTCGRECQMLEFFAEYGCVRVVQLIHGFEAQEERSNPASLAAAEVSNWSVTPAEYAETVVALTKGWAEMGLYERFLLEPIYSIVRVLLGRSPILCHYSDRKCQHITTLYPDGRVGRCDELPEALSWMGHQAQIGPQGGAAPPATEAFATAVRELAEQCAGCRWLSCCRGGCIAARWRLAASGRASEYCDAQKRMIEFVAEQIGVIGQLTSSEGDHHE